ncbi:hypothetical protein [Pseudomonas baltica]|uniref:Cap15 family cyclic dinucleotide receptor domain-containing protein n=1 Tax=Pseudomonas baltica TaxID=2762576 RepID=UPI0039088E5A
MFLIIYPLRVIGVVAVAYCICVIGLHFLFSECCPEYAPELFGMVLRGGALLNFVLLVFVYWGWGRLWASFHALNSWLFPDLNGEWDMTIHYRNNCLSGEVRTTAVIKQSWLSMSMSMEVLSHDSDSQTLAIVPKKDPESGRAQIFYFYRVIPKKTGVGRGSLMKGLPIWGSP